MTSPSIATAASPDSRADERGMFVLRDGRNVAFTFMLLLMLFALWGFCNGMIDVMDKHFQEELHLSLSQSAWVQTAHYLGYLLMAFPAGWLATRLGYRGGLIVGLIMVSCGGFWFIPATHIAQFWAFLVGVCIIAAGMMIPAALAAAQVLESHGVSAAVLNVPVIKPLDAATIVAAARHSRLAITAENHNIIGGLGSAVAEALAEAGVGVPLRRVGIADVFGESGSREFLFQRYGLSTQNILDIAWRGLGLGGSVPIAPVVESVPGAYAPV